MTSIRTWYCFLVRLSAYSQLEIDDAKQDWIYCFFSRHINSSWISMCWRFPPFFMDVQPYIMEDTSPQCGKEIIWMIWKANGIKRRSQRSKSGFMKFPNIFAIRREILFKCCSLRDERQTRRGLKLFLNLISNKLQGELYCFDLNSNAI